MDISSLKIFIEVLQRGSFSAVARHLNVSPSSISRTIAALEEELGIRLFQRNTRRLELTEAGSKYFDQIEQSVKKIEDAGNRVNELRGIPQGTLRITTPVDFGQLIVTPLLPKFSLSFPEIQFDLLFADQVLDLLVERIDIAVRLSAPTDYSYIGTKLFNENFIVCASPAYINQNGHPTTPSEITQHNCMHFPMAAYKQWNFNHKDKPAEQVSVLSTLQTTNSVVLRDCTLASMGIALLPHWAIWQELENKRLINLFPFYKISISDLTTAAWLMYPTRDHLPLKVRVFVDFMKTQRFNWSTPSIQS